MNLRFDSLVTVSPEAVSKVVTSELAASVIQKMKLNGKRQEKRAFIALKTILLRNCPLQTIVTFWMRLMLYMFL